MRIFITGHRGYLGSILTPYLVKHGHEVAGTDSRLFESCRFEGELLEVPDLGKDIRHIAAADLEGYDAVVHLAGLSNDPLGDYRPELTRDINERAAVAVARQAAAAGVERFVFASSCSVYGAAGEEFLHEDSPFNPVTPYAVAKAHAEREISAMASDSFSPVQVRCGTVFGVSPRIRFDLVLNNLVAWTLSTGEVHLKSDGRAWRPLVHVEDVARAYRAILEAPRDRVHDEAFNVGRTNENYRVIELAGIIERKVPGARIGFGAEPNRDQRNYRVSCDKIAARLPAFKPRWNVERGVEELVAALRRCPVDPAAFEGERFSRIAHVKHLRATGAIDEDLYPVFA